MALRLAFILVVWTAAGCTDEPGAAADAAPAADAGLSSDTAPGADGSAADAAAPFRVALSVSPFAERLLAAGLTISDGVSTPTTIAEQEAFFVGYGGTEVFIRVSTERAPSPRAEDRSLARALERAQVARALELPLNPELGLFGTYGDVSCQTVPRFAEYPEVSIQGDWLTLTVAEMEQALGEYAALAARAILDTGVVVNVWDLGNEIDLGTAGIAPAPLPGAACDATEGTTGWYRAPDNVDPAIGQESVASLYAMAEPARIAWLTAHVWPHTGRLLAAAQRGVRTVEPGARFSTHISNSLSPTFAVAFYQAMAGAGFAIDEAGFSYYPSASAAPAARNTALRETVAAVQALGLEVFIAEYAYPAEPVTGPFASWTHALAHYPIADAGQHDLLRDLTSYAVAAGVTGVRPWAPDTFVPGWGGFSLFTASGMARPSLGAMQEGLAAPSVDALRD